MLQMLVIDTTDDSFTSIGTLDSSEKTSGGVLAPNGNIYGVPMDATYSVKIDTSTDTVSTVGTFLGS